jgi:drug/metabolite transporter (DMT)-like permease
VWWRTILVSSALLLIPRFWRGITALRSRLAVTYAFIGTIVAVHWLMFYGSIKLSNASVAATCMAMAPLFVAFIEPVIVGRRFERRELFFGIAVVPGVALVVGGIPAEMRTGLAVGILSAMLAAIFGTLNKRYIEHGGALTVTGLEMIAGAVFLTTIGVALPRLPPMFVKPPAHDVVLLLVLAIACTLVPFALSLSAQRHLSAFTTALAVNMEPVYAIVLAILLLGEQHELSSSFYLGVIVVLAVVFIHPLWLVESSKNALIR